MCTLKDELENKEQSLRWHSLELQRKNLELQEISYTDPLTGVWNRRYLEEILTAEAGQVLRNYERACGADIRNMDHRDLVFLMVDVDFFKEVTICMVTLPAIACCSWWQSVWARWCASPMSWCVGEEKNS